MSNSPETDLGLDLQFLPAWAQKSAEPNRYANYAGERGPADRRQDRGERGPRPGDRSGPKDGQRGPSGPRKPQDRRRPEDRPRREQAPPAPLPELNVAFKPDDIGVDSLARQIKMTGRAYPLFDIAQMILQKPERHSLTISVEKKADGQVVQPLFVCALDDSLWLSEAEAVQYVLDKHFATFYQPERTQVDPPKGTYTFVAQCGMSGVILGPPNYHDYQNQLRKLHAERFSRMPFEAYKARVKIVRDEEVVKKWVEDQSWKTEYICLNMPEPLRLSSMEAVEKHFRETHKENIVKKVESHTMSGTAARSLRSPELVRLVRTLWEDQKRFPLQVATGLSQQFAARGLQFFKVNKTITHVCVARPHYLDLEATPVSEGIRKIVEFINTHPQSTRRPLIDALAPSPTPAVIPVQPIAEPIEGQPQTAPGAAPAAPEPTPNQTSVIADLHWLIHQGHVIEFANGVLETAKKPAPKPPKPEAKAEAASAEAPVEMTAAPGPTEAPIQPAESQQQVAAQAAVEEGSGAAPAEEAAAPD